MRSLLWRPGHTAQSMVAAVENRCVPVRPIAQMPSTAATVTSGTNDYGAWVELVASTPADWRGLWVGNPTATGSALTSSGASVAAVVDIGIGGAPETVLVSAIDVSSRQFQDFSPTLLDLPNLFIPRGTRITARLASSTSSNTVPLAANGYTPAVGGYVPPPLTKVTTLTTLGTRRGPSVAPGASWTEVVASTAVPVSALFVSIGSNDINMASAGIAFDLGVGTSGVETLVWTTTISVTNLELTRGNAFGFIPIRLAAGTRIVARCQTETMSCTIHGLS